ncbi:putative UDP-rhamnose:rhamnosyltransferase 1 [Bienertia sinuspersici]
MDSEQKKLHIVMFPWLAFGHMMPFLELSKCLATKGHHIFFVSTPRNIQRLHKIPHHLSPFITFVPLSLPRLEGLPHNAEATTDVGYEMGYDLLKKAYDGLQEPMTKFLVSTFSSPHPIDWIIYDFSCYWLPPIADKLGIRKVFFSIFSARLLAIIGPVSQDDADADGVGLWSCPEILTSPPHWIPFLSSTVYLLPYEARPFFQALTAKTSSGVSDMFRYQTCVKGSDMIAVRSCMELEDEYLNLVEKLNQKTVVPVGMLPPFVEEIQDNDDDDNAWKSINGWLEKQRYGSVVYVAFGSEFEPNQEQVIEIALGLELSGVPFFWVFRTSLISSLELPEGFEERTRDRGMIYRSWVPQVRILSHDSVGGFLTHAGMSSIIEPLMLGKPLVMLPLGGDQGLNARFMAEKKTGIEIPRNVEDGSFTRSSVAESLVLMLLDEAGKTYRDHAKKISAIFADKSIQSRCIDKFCNYLYEYKSTI